MKALTSILLVIIVIAALGLWFEEELVLAAGWLVDRIGFAGMCLILFITDTLVTPVSPDILLLMIAKSELARQWPRYVLILGMVSVGAGMLGWFVGRWLGHFKFSRRLFDRFNDEQRGFIRKYGFWAIVLGAATPLPYSVTCWTAGAVGIRWPTVLAASLLFRIPRIILYYQLIASASNLPD
jgi:membrane protein YqaA with SNARE-associated domain